jgi:hypothetical protein
MTGGFCPAIRWGSYGSILRAIDRRKNGNLQRNQQ